MEYYNNETEINNQEESFIIDNSIHLMSTFIDTLIKFEQHNDEDDSEQWKQLVKNDNLKNDIRKIFQIQLKYIEAMAKAELSSYE